MKRIFLSITATVICLVLLEIAARYFYPQYCNYNTEMWRYAALIKRPSDFPGMGHEHRPNAKANLYGVEVKTNRLGFRGTAPLSDIKREGTHRILVLGDSITMGWGVDERDTYPNLLARLLNRQSPRYEVINTGVGNYNTQSELATLKKFLYLKPDSIVLGFYINDIEEVHYPSRLLYQFISHSFFYGLMTDRLINLEYAKHNSYVDHYRSLYQDTRNRDRLYQELAEIVEISKKSHIPILIVNIPEFHQFNPYPFPEVTQFLETFVQENSYAQYLDLLPTLSIHKPRTLWVSAEDHHPNAIGQQLIATAIHQKLKESDDAKIPSERHTHLP